MKNIFPLILIALFYSCKSDQQKTKNVENNLYKTTDIEYNLGDVTSGLEGPAVDVNGNLYFVNPFKSGSIGMFDPPGQFQMFIDQLPEGSTGNGIRFGSRGMMYIADYTGHNILQVNMTNKKITVYAHNDGMTQPNDIAITSSNIIFASDPDWKNESGQIWRIDTNGTFTLLETNMGTTNGIEVSPDEKTLYVNESVQRNIWAYDLSKTGDISNKRLLAKVKDFGMDGMRCDVEGNLYITRHGKGTILILSPSGEKINEVTLKGKKPSNIAFGGSEGKTCFVTLQDRGFIEKFETAHAGRTFVMNSK
ncbi:SMP-30/gluconolactonase/LRE family protein [Reichenbachiella sp. MALMAid0571]|uniref:SMP-30/gluconolactonase/LRE family protein n=1 Tax=Reichenbachiella sp. MALMAid0571 TaxID=3143939 RepID=UPI0032DF8E6F